tara:strand:- start:75 stop:638 length:564 start_codon:yes stop_codon:yes gene_type:complete
MHIKSFNYKDKSINEDELSTKSQNAEKKGFIEEPKKETINQIKNVTQEKRVKPEIKTDVINENKIIINSFQELLNICIDKKELKLRYEIENNVNLVSFENNRIEISFNENLDKNFIKDLSSKLYLWTGQRWIISLSKEKGKISLKQQIEKNKIELIKDVKNSKFYKTVLEKFKDANLLDVTKDKDEI